MNEEPIELEFIINAPELLEQASQVRQGLESVDNAVARSENNFQEYINAQLEASNAMAQNVRLTKEQQRAYETYANAISGLTQMMQETTDPTQIGIYEYKIKELTKSIEDLLSRANSNEVSVIDTEKLEEAGRLIDSISDKTFTPSFASTEELELLSTRINEAQSEFEQLEVVIDFVNARLESIGDNDTLVALQDDIAQANQLLGNTVERYDATGNSINEMTDALKTFKEQLANETDPQNIITLNQNIEDLENRIRQIGNAGREGFDELGNTIEVQRETVRGLKGQLAELVQQMAQMRLQGQENTAQYRELARQATDLAGALSTVNEEVRFSASASSGLDTLIRATKGVASGYALAQSASALFGDEQKDLQQTLVKITAVLSLLQGLQTIQLELARKDSLITKTLTYLKGLYAKAVGNSTGALRIFRIALLATGLGVAIVLMGELIANWSKFKKVIGLSSDELERNQEINKKANSLYGEKIAKLQILASTNEKVTLTEEQKKQAVKDYNSEFGNVLGSVKDYNELETKIIKNVGNYIEYLNVKAQAEAAYMLSLERQKKLLEEITALSSGDLKWYDQLQNITDNIFEKGYKLFNIDIGENRKEISQKEVLDIIGLPSEEDFNKALSSYNGVIQGNLRSFRKKQEQDKGILEASYDLQKKAGELADKYKIKADDKTKVDNSTKKAFEERIKALAAISKAEDDLAKKRLTGLQKDLLEIEQRYAKLREDAKKAKLDTRDLDRIDKLEKEEVISVKYTSDTDKLKKQLEESKRIYEEYEEFKKSTSEQKANETFKELINTQKGYYDLLSDELDKINPNDMTAEAKERYGMLTALLIDYTENKGKIEREELEKLYNLTATTEQKLYALRDKYAKLNLALLSKYSGKELENRQKILGTQAQGEFNSLADEILKNSGHFVNALEIISTATKGQIQKQITDLSKFLEENKNISSEQRKVVEGIIRDLTNKLPNAQDDKRSIQTNLGVVNSQIQATKNELEKLKTARLRLKRTNDESYESFMQRVTEMDLAVKLLEMRLGSLNLDKIAAIGQDMGQLGDQFMGFSNAIAELNPGLSDLFKTLSAGFKIFESITKLISAVGSALKESGKQSGNYWTAIIGAVLEIVGQIANVWSGIVQKQKQAYKEFLKWQMDVYRGELEYQALLRKRRYDSISNKTTDKTMLSSQLEELKKQTPEIQAEYEKQLEMIQNNGKFIEKRWRSKSFWRSKTKTDWGDMFGFDYNEMEKLYTTNKLEGDTKAWFEELKKLKEELGDVQKAIEETENAWLEAMTGSSVSSLTDSIKNGLAEGKRSFEDFADDIEGILKNAILQGMITDTLNEGVKDLQKELAAMMGDGELSTADADKIREMYMKLVEEAQKNMEALNKAGIDFSGGDDKNSLKGAIKGMTENQADLLSGQIGGWRLAQLETNSILTRSFTSQLEILSRQVALQMQIEVNTRQTSGYTERTAKAIEELLSKTKTSNVDVLKANGAWTP
ncbi:hypothetical protein [Myroides odoratimimus]|uniref:hypothetical protein n=1 Tax=Myroides odoratimimus TaxID=76832 RepID=UPI0025782263|nr:hypothetical protein [Myroides odoratimimus]MDM1093424.1 hypothetical protein [Myroides odoratimimus]